MILGMQMASKEEPVVDGAMAEEAVAATFKVLVLGSSHVGKTSLIQAYAHGKKPDTHHQPTLGRKELLLCYREAGS